MDLEIKVTEQELLGRYKLICPSEKDVIGLRITRGSLADGILAYGMWVGGESGDAAHITVAPIHNSFDSQNRSVRVLSRSTDLEAKKFTLTPRDYSKYEEFPYIFVRDVPINNLVRKYREYNGISLQPEYYTDLVKEPVKKNNYYMNDAGFIYYAAVDYPTGKQAYRMYTVRLDRQYTTNEEINNGLLKHIGQTLVFFNK